MQNKTKRRWLDIQIILASIAVTLTVGLWNVFAKGNRPVVNPAGIQPPDPAFTYTLTPNPITTTIVDPNAPIHLPPVHLLLGGRMPVAPVIMASSSPSDQNQNVGLTGGSGGLGNPAPPPASTGSSKK